MPQTTYYLNCLGVPELHTGDGRFVRVRVRKHLALLVYLAVERRGLHARGRLVELLWPGVSQERGRHSFATALSVLRSIFGHSAFATVQQAIRFSPTNLHLDLERLENGVVGPDGESIVAVDGFLRGFDIEDAPEFSLWKEHQHSRHLPAIHSGLLTLIDLGRRRGSHEQIMQWADRLLAVDYLAEEGIRAKMESLALAGDRVSALRVFDDWKDRLRREVGAEPSHIIEGMAANLRRRDWDGVTPRPQRAASSFPSNPRRLVGREAEYRQAFELWEAARQSRPHHLMIAAESGMGKTALANRLLAAAQVEGASIGRVQCFAMEKHVAFGAVGSLVTGLLTRPGAAAAAPDALAEMARVIPAVRRRFPSLGIANPSDPETARLLLAEAVAEFLSSVAYERPVLLVVDDVHHADEASLSVLHRAIRRLSPCRLLVVTCSPVRTEFLPSPNGMGQATIALPPLSEEDSTTLAADLCRSSGQTPSPTEMRALVRSAKGNPLVLELLMSDWIRHGGQSIALALEAAVEEMPRLQPQPDSRISQLFGRTIDAMPRKTRDALSVAAVIGKEISDLRLYRVVDLDEASATGALNELVSSRLLREVDGGLEFANGLLRAHVYASTPGILRTHLHSAVADRLRLDAARSQSSDLTIGWHLVRAHRSSEAGPLLVNGAKASLRHGAPDDVILALRTAIPSLADEIRSDAVLILADALHETSRWEDGLALLAGHPELEAAPFRLRAVEARWRLNRLQPDDKEAAIHDLLAIGADRGFEAWPQAFLLAALIAGEVRSYSLLAHVWSQIPTADDLAGAPAATLLTARAVTDFHSRNLARSETHASAALRILKDLGAADSSRARLEMGLGALRIANGDYSNAVAHLTSAATLGSRLDNVAIQSTATAGLSLALFRLGEFETALDWAARLPASADWSSQLTSAYAEAGSLFSIGRTGAALITQARADQVAAATDCEWLRQKWMLDSADIFVLCGRRKQAVAAAAIAVANAWKEPLARSSFGPFARWTAAVRGRAEGWQPRDEEWSYLDAIDRYEILVSQCDDRDSTLDSDVASSRGRLPTAAADWVDVVTRASRVPPSPAGM